VRGRIQRVHDLGAVDRNRKYMVEYIDANRCRHDLLIKRMRVSLRAYTPPLRNAEHLLGLQCIRHHLLGQQLQFGETERGECVLQRS
jgi:hypothetical protein